MHPIDPLGTPLGTALALLVGRTALALLPPGSPGSHAARELPATLAASLLLGFAVLALELVLLGGASGIWLASAPWAAIAALRGGTVVGDHSVIFAGPAERITMSHHAEDRALFARGALKAALWARSKPAGLYSMADVLGLTD